MPSKEFPPAAVFVFPRQIAATRSFSGVTRAIRVIAKTFVFSHFWGKPPS